MNVTVEVLGQRRCERTPVGEEHGSQVHAHYAYLMGLQHSENYRVFTASVEKQQTVEWVT